MNSREIRNPLLHFGCILGIERNRKKIHLKLEKIVPTAGTYINYHTNTSSFWCLEYLPLFLSIDIIFERIKRLGPKWEINLDKLLSISSSSDTLRSRWGPLLSGDQNLFLLRITPHGTSPTTILRRYRHTLESRNNDAVKRVGEFTAAGLCFDRGTRSFRCAN